MYINTANESYTKFTFEITGITLPDNESEHKFEYCIAGKSSDNIKEEWWTIIDKEKLVKQSDGTYTLFIDIDTRELKNENELMNIENPYIHIKETSILGEREEVQYNSYILQESETTDVQVYYNNESVDLEELLEQNSSQNSTDETVASKIIPNAGLGQIILIVAVVLTSIGIVCYIRYRTIDK